MKNRYSNICVYAFDKSVHEKQQKAFDLLKNRPVISSQVIIETHNACFRKLKLQQPVCEETVLLLTDICHVVEIKHTTIRTAIVLKRKYCFSFLDSLIIATALDSKCTILYSEDMHHEQIIENPEKNGARTLTIINPFV
ncbi:MAG: hypothetical protein A2275_03225 [Bacteroidetes bacterium RIFOXYA12_FULL_35_11]|nr:MAG: hypothetical protein A2X01_15885 [Bacteroidetes bacterium GWF2_35_48]OFY73284.1 MAG: hypothetical protein A2275_03225 [Bacteroidetes bacterium RIFOXYA12_FULL_35_11]